MQRLKLLILLACALAALAGCSEDRASDPFAPVDGTTIAPPAGFDPEAAAVDLIARTGWEFDPEVALPAGQLGLNAKAARPRILNLERVELAGSVVHYTFEIAYGPGCRP